MMEQKEDKIDDDLDFSYVEQCHKQLDKLRKEILAFEEDNNVGKYSTYHRLFKYNVFDYIEPKKRQYLDKVLVRILSSLGNHIQNNLRKMNIENQTTTMRTPTPASFTTNSNYSYNMRSRSTSYSEPTNKSISGDSCTMERCHDVEVIVISSDDDDDDFFPKKIKTCDVNELDSEVIIKQEKSFDIDQPQGTFVGLEDITNSFNNRPSTNNQQQNNEESYYSNSQIPTKLPPNTLALVSTRDLSNYFYDKYGVINLKPKNKIKYTAAKRNKQATILHLIAKVLNLIESGTYMTRRELYYKSQNFCIIKKKPSAQSQSSGIGTQSQPNSTQNTKSSQDRLNSNKLFRALDDLCCLIGCSKVHLHVLSQSKGLIYGNLVFKVDTGEYYNCLDNKEGTHLPTSHSPIVEMYSDAKFVLILEKDSIMQKLLNNEQLSSFIESYKVILFTAKGYPDVTSRAFIKYVWTKLKIPILALTDADPHGIEIVCSYKFGVYTTAYESTYTSVPQIKWLGFLPSEIKKLSISVDKTAPQNVTDIRKLDSLARRPYLLKEKNWMNEIRLLKTMGRKAELEALGEEGDYLIQTYLPNKLRFGSWF